GNGGGPYRQFVDGELPGLAGPGRGGAQGQVEGDAGLGQPAARYPDDPEVTALVRELRSGSEEFSRLWASHDVDTEPTLRKTFRHPLVGPVTVNCDALDLTDRDQQVVIYTAVPGSPSEEALRLLSVIGTQHMSAPR
ncbi:MmyB family transcriptional regulator, partial [Streptomyces sp. NPDC004561]